VISPTQRPLPDNTQQSQETDIHAPGGIRTHDPSKRAAADPRLRPRSHWDWRQDIILLSRSLFYLLTVGVEVVYFHLITLKHTTQSVGLLWTKDRPVAETSTSQFKQSQETNIHAPGGIRTHDPSKRSAADLRNKNKRVPVHAHGGMGAGEGI
jgi:hypothetical protein